MTKIKPQYFFDRGGQNAMNRFFEKHPIQPMPPGVDGGFPGGDPVEMTEEEIKSILPSYSKEDYRDWLIVDY